MHYAVHHDALDYTVKQGSYYASPAEAVYLLDQLGLDRLVPVSASLRLTGFASELDANPVGAGAACPQSN